MSHDQVDSASPGSTLASSINRASYVSSTLPRSRPTMQTFEQPATAIAPALKAPVIPFQRSNNAYWTLQTRKHPPSHAAQLPPTPRDDLQLNTATKPRLEDLYSTPNKLLKTRKTNGTTAAEQLRPTVQGFATYFSPIPKAQSIEPQRISPIDPRNVAASFKTSTPTKPASPLVSLTDELRQKLHIKETGGFGSNVSSPISSGRSTPRLEPQHGRGAETDLSQNCSDRLGAPKTSLMDFKKLLLTKAGKTVPAAAKPSAVEQLKLARVAAASAAAASSPSPINSSLNIIDMSASPKTFANRRMIRQGNFGSPSKNNSNNQPSAIGKHMSPRSAWKFSNYRTDVMSTAIPEANSEEDGSPNSSKDKGTVPKSVSLGGLIRSSSEEPIVRTDAPSSSDGIVADNINLKNNIFLQAEENNFMRGEVGTKSLSRAQLQQARSHFLASASSSSSAGPKSPLQPLRSAQFKNGHYTGISPTRKPAAVPTANQMFRANTEAIIDTSAEGAPAPSLETAL